MLWYIDLVKSYPVLTAAIQFAILGTLGDTLAKWFTLKRIYQPYTFGKFLLKMLEWSILAVCIKYAFVGFKGFTETLIEQNYLPQWGGLFKAFALSTFMNLQFGPFLVLAHRLLDNLIAGETNWKNIDKGFFSLIWFWIPAHTITFALPKEFQIGLAACWSVVLGLILGFYNSKK